jgi:hypothetical protein
MPVKPCSAGWRRRCEETGLVVESWVRLSYTVIVDAPDMGWRLRVEAWEADVVSGDIVLADPDGIVEQVRHVDAAEAPGLLAQSPPWVHTPVGEWLAGSRAPSYPVVLYGPARGRGRGERAPVWWRRQRGRQRGYARSSMSTWTRSSSASSWCAAPSCAAGRWWWAARARVG